MDYEKKYKEALDRAKEWLNIKEPFSGTCTCVVESIFPELKESEDERIRKDIIYFFSRNTFQFGEDIDKYKSWIAWLEKQGKKESDDEIIPDKNEVRDKDEIIRKRILISIQKDIAVTRKAGWSTNNLEECIAWIEKQGDKDSQVTLPPFTFDDILALQCCMETVKKVQEDKDLYEKLNDLHGRVYDAYQLEKQSEQKSTDKVEPKFKIGDYVKNVNDKREPIYEIVYMDKECYICEYRGKERMGDKAVMHFAFDNPYLRLVEPKFDVDDWVVRKDGKNFADGRKTVRITRFDGERYWFDSGTYLQPKDIRLWNIADAKAGDVLYSPCLSLLWIFKSKDTVHCGCNLNYNDGAFFGEEFFKMPTDATPATKEQRDLLFKKMGEAGYTWDENKLELKKPYIAPTTEVIETKTEEPIACSYYDDHHSGKPGHGWGDKNHDHVGPPGQNKKNGITDIWEDL